MSGRAVSRWLANNASVVVLVALCAYYSVSTWEEYHPSDASAGRVLARRILSESTEAAASVLIVAPESREAAAFTDAVAEGLEEGGATVAATFHAGGPLDVTRELSRLAERGVKLTAIATNQRASQWGPLQPERIAGKFPTLGAVTLYVPESYRWSRFLTRDNLLNVLANNADVAIIAIGMTMVIITSGIDLSVGSILAIAAVVTAVCGRNLAGGDVAGSFEVAVAAALAIGLCALSGLFNGVMVTKFRVPAFIVTLSMMMIGRGVALKLAVANTEAGTPETVSLTSPTFDWIGNGYVAGIPNPVILMAVLFAVAHILMTRTAVGRSIYAVGGNPEAARLSGVPVTTVLLFVYAACGALAGLAGVLDASRFGGGRPNAGELYELRVIAAVVVGGTSLAGGEGRILGTLTGALIIAVIANGLNMAGVQSYDRMIVFGVLILAAVLFDQVKRRM
jgi:ribose transport system permease protein